MTETVNIHAAKTHLSKLIERALDGEDVVIAKNGTPLVRLEPVAGALKKRKPILGRLKGKVWVSDDFDGPLPPDIQRYFEGESDPEDGF